VSKQFIAVVHASLVMGDRELPLLAKVRFTHHPARAATPPSYASGGEPPEGESVEDVEVIDLVSDVDGFCPTLERAQWVCDFIAESADKSDLLAEVDYGPDPDEMRDRMKDREMHKDEWRDDE
jgi:hypothetical protein